MRIGIRTKFILLISILLFIIFGTITVFQIRGNTRNLRSDLFEESRAFASLATQPIGNVFAIYKDSGTFKIDQQIDTFSKLNGSVVNIAIVDINGKTIYSKNKDASLDVTADEASTFEALYQNNQAGALETIIYPYFEASGAHRYSLVYTISDKEINTEVQREAKSLLYFGLASLLATMALVYLLINRFIIKPVRQVSEQAGVISAGNLEQQILVHGHDEIAFLGESVNKMAESLKANIAQLQEVDKVKSEFMMITSHNLRTPLTIINGYLDNMSLVMGDADKLMAALTRIGSSVKRLEIFAEDVLTISRFELGDAQLQADSVKLGEFAKRIADEFLPTAELKDIKFTSDIQDGDTELQISVPYIRSAVWNILDNAAKFTSEGGQISFKTKRDGDFVEIIVSDNGIGISAAELPKLFTKFHRGTSTLTYDFEGTGIGLYASKVMVAKHGGTISAASEEGKGSTFIIRLPIKSTIVTPKQLS
jgi:two-component system sensor histidine kinase MtrB